jgi:methylmalonyl-CoA/ethylmalonyl-CoA epimerase
MDDVTFDHIGVAVESIDRALVFFEGVLGLRVAEREEVPGQGVRVAKLHTGKTVIELIEPTGEDTPVGKFLARNGEGIHHICFGTADALSLVRRASESGIKALSEDLQPGASGKKVIFFHPKSTHRILVELAQAADSGGAGGE